MNIKKEKGASVFLDGRSRAGHLRGHAYGAYFARDSARISRGTKYFWSSFCIGERSVLSVTGLASRIVYP